MNCIKAFTLLAVFTVATFSCTKREEFPPQPIVKNVFVQLNTDLSGSLSLDFTDGDGNLGLNSTTDTSGVFHPDSVNGNNLLLGYFESKNGVWVRDTSVEETFKYRIDRLESRGKNDVLQGTITVALPIAYNFSSPFDTIRYSAILIDRSLNRSEEVFSQILVKPN